MVNHLDWQSRFRVSTTWIGADHLLLVDRHLFVETYRRVYFHDIQAIVTTPTPRHLFWLVVLSLWSLIVVALALDAQGGWRIFWAVPAGAVVAALGLHIARGPTWTCHIRTPLQVVELRAQRRRRWVLRSLRRLRPLLDDRQGSVPREAILAALAGGAGVGPAPAASQDPTPAPSTGPPPIGRRENGLLAWILVFGLLAEAAISAVQMSFRDPVINLVAIALFLAEVGVAIAIATRRGGRGAAATLRLFGWSTLVYMTGMFVIGTAVGIVRAITAIMRAAAAGEEAPFDAYALAAQPRGLALFWIVGALGLALWGLFLLRRLRAENESLWLNLKDSPGGVV